MAKRIAVLGASGYAGAELVGLLLGHPEAELVALRGSSARDVNLGGAGAVRFTDLFPRFAGQCDLSVAPLDRDELIALEPDAVFLATPHELSHDLAPDLVARGIVTFDLSAAFRLSDLSAYPTYYGFPHAQPDLLRAAAYGVPELFAEKIAQTDLIAVPGCYATSAVIPLRPLVDAGLLRSDRETIVDSASGVSGAGRKAETKSLFCEVSLQAYGVFSHRHRPEMIEHAKCGVCFTPHLVAFDRGILSTIHAWLKPGVGVADVRNILAARYRDQPFVRLLPPGAWPSVAAVRNTNCCDIAVAVEGDHLLMECALDNLVKGAAGQAVQCMNIRFGLPQALGLPGAVPVQRSRAGGGIGGESSWTN